MAKSNGSGGGLYRILEWIMWIAYINLLWVGFSLLGLIVLGVFPATVAGFTVIRGLLMKNTDTPIIKTFFRTYKNEFFKSNAIGFIFVVVGYILYLDFVFIGNINGLLFYVLQIGLVFVSLVYLIALLYIMPVYVHFDLNFTRYFKQAIQIGIFSPLMTIAMVLGLFIVYFLITLIPGLIPLFAFGASAFVIMACGLFAFHRLENKQRLLNEPKEKKE
ncbi:DUF624 domain-containing protein [Aquibacillus halophilus]|uniref:DUF624 domain-containing protein n=1 Tax=Aquibacillus halophilus TaxID=930132 RepID=A0A6A8DG88_9BACI|nr:YesL family protein [Aquibacillus halophilus]MRH42791.1 DUF624 domain-containing protein [Aquibacillus halophilus]